MEYLEQDLSLEECLTYLNAMGKSILDQDTSGNEVSYIIVAPEEIVTLEKITGSNERAIMYLKEFGVEDWQEEGFDIVPIWIEINALFGVEIWLKGDKGKNTFYIKNGLELDFKPIG